jgi:predicted transcriptional regulator
MQDHEDPTQCCRDIENGAGKALGHSWPEVRLHLALLKDMGLVAECTSPAEYRLTSCGYDVIESADPVERLRQWTTRDSSTAHTAATSRQPLPPALHSSRSVS